jgi:proprotein convertase subtilisin/kexin type 1
LNSKRSDSGWPSLSAGEIEWAAEQAILKRDKRGPIFNDELWESEWYLKGGRSKRDGSSNYDLNVLAAYQLGFSGRGIRVAVLDDGIEYNHDDLYGNFDPEISWDFNNDRADPRPEKNDRFNAHGTRCAGEIAMMANNGKCGVGVAFNANIGGIKLLGGPVYDYIEVILNVT